MTTRHLACVAVIAAIVAAAAHRADAQDVSRVGFNTAGLVSIQPVDHSDPAEEAFRGVLTFGTDIITFIGPRASLLVTGRAYPWIQRGDSAQQLGVGRHVFRVGAGIRLSISKD